MATEFSRPWVRSGVILGIVDFLERNGFDPKAVIGKAPIRMVEAADAYRQVDMLTIMSLFQKVADHTHRPDIGLELGLSVDLQQMGPFGFLFMNAPTVGYTVSDFVRFGPLFQTQAHFGLRRGRHRFCLEYVSNHPEMPGWEIDSEVTVAYIMGIVNGVAGESIKPSAIDMDHSPICNALDYIRYLSIRPRFGRRMNRIYYPMALLDHPVPNANPHLYKVLRRHMTDLAGAMPREDDLVDIIANNIRRGLGTDTVSLEHIASELGVESRTLQRQLVRAGTSFQKIFDQVRRDLACYYLERTALDVATIALELGYSEASVFSRAFKRWTGSSPDRHRKQYHN
jgi:AraC-like DNA-binding protein